MLYLIAYLIMYPVFKLIYRFKIIRAAPIPKGALLVCANHSHAIDPIFLAFVLGIRARPSFMAKQQLFEKRFISWVLRGLGAFPVERDRVSASNAVKDSLRTLKSGRPLSLFPEGRRVRPGEQEEAKAGAGLFAAHTGCPVLPVYIQTEKPPFRRVYIMAGEAYYPGGEAKSSDYKEISEEIMERIQALAPEMHKSK